MKELIATILTVFVFLGVAHLAGWYITQDMLWFYTSVTGRIIAVVITLYVIYTAITEYEQ